MYSVLIITNVVSSNPTFDKSVLDTTLCRGLEEGQWFSPDSPVSTTNISDRHDISEILLKVALSAITLTP